MYSKAEQVTQAISEGQPPFDGRCQLCSRERASVLLPTRLYFLEERTLTGNEFSVSGTGVNIGYAPAEETWRTVFIPCFFCEACSDKFRNSWRKSWLKTNISRVVRMLWILPTAIIAIVLIAMLPFVGWTVGAFIIYAIYRNMTRKRADEFLVSHIRGLGIAGELLEEDEFILKWDRFRGVAQL